MLQRIPALIAAVCLTIYWFWVLVKLVRLARKIGKDPNAIPRERVGQLMRIVWYPCVLVLLVALWLAVWLPAEGLSGGPAMPSPALFGNGARRLWLSWRLAPTLWWAIAIIPASLACIVCTGLTFVCWRKMGHSWRIGIDPNEKLALVSTGPYRYVRHPIYALRMVINACAFLMAPTLLVALPAGIDVLLLHIEARREERYMETQHGEQYARYKNSVGRFIPRAFVG